MARVPLSGRGLPNPGLSADRLAETSLIHRYARWERGQVLVLSARQSDGDRAGKRLAPPPDADCAGILLFSCLLLSALMLTPHSGTARRTGSTTGRTGVVNLVEVRFSSQAVLLRALRQHPARLVRVLAALHVAEVRPNGDLRAFERAIRDVAGISSVRQVMVRTVARDSAYVPSAAIASGGTLEWQFSAIGVDRVPVAVISAARKITIAVVDTGADSSAPDLAGRIAGAYDVRTRVRTAADRNGHGTFVASLAAAAAGTAGSGVVTESNGGARLLIVKVADGSSFTDLDVAGGILYAVAHGARIINLSVAGRWPSPVEEAAVDYAAGRGVLLVAAAGNDALNGDPPSIRRRISSLSALRESGGLALWSAPPISSEIELRSRSSARSCPSPPRASRSSARSPRGRRRLCFRAVRSTAFPPQGCTARQAERRSRRRKSRVRLLSYGLRILSSLPGRSLTS